LVDQIPRHNTVADTDNKHAAWLAAEYEIELLPVTAPMGK